MADSVVKLYKNTYPESRFKQEQNEPDKHYLDRLIDIDPKFRSDDFLGKVADKYFQIGDIIKYSVVSKSQDKRNVSSRQFAVSESFQNNATHKSRAAFAYIVKQIGKERFFDYTPSSNYMDFSDKQDIEYWDNILPDFEFETVITPDLGFGFFPRELPNYTEQVRLAYNFNDDDNLFCALTALYKQDKRFILPNIDGSNDSYYELYRKIGFETEDAFRLSKRKLLELYRNFIEAYNLNIEIYIYHFKDLNNDIPFVKKLNRGFTKDKVGVKKSANKFYVARLRDHVFNVQGGNEKGKVHCLNYLERVRCMYHSLPLKQKDMSRIARNQAKEYKEYIRKRNSNLGMLLRNADKRIDELTSLEKEKPKIKENKFVFIYDLETVNKEDGKFLVYSYYIRCVQYPDYYKEQGYPDIKDGFNIYFKDATVENRYIEKEVVRILKSPLTDMFNYVAANVPKDAKVILFAHNGSNFDNIITRELMMSSDNFSRISEYCTGQNQGIMLSLEARFTVFNAESRGKKKNRILPIPIEAFNENFRADKDKPASSGAPPCTKSIYVSLRDSKKIINYPVFKLPKAFGTKSYKLPYDYEFYQRLITTVSKEVRDNMFKGKIPFFCREQTDLMKPNIMFFLKKEFSEDFANEYWDIISGEYTDKLEDTKFKRDIIAYLNYLNQINKIYDINMYCKLYNCYDVLVVAEAMERFQEYIRGLDSIEALSDVVEKYTGKPLECGIGTKTPEPVPGANKINVYGYRSLASIVYDMCHNYGVYENIYKAKGDLKLFFQASVVGGRVMCGKNHHYKSENYDSIVKYIGQEATKENVDSLKELLTDVICDFDGVSLYPSAISITKMPAGKPDIKDFSYYPEDAARLLPYLLQTKEKYFVCCDLETTIDLEYPILSDLKEDGTRNFRNGKFEQIVLGDMAFKDVYKYQKIKLLKVYTLVRFPQTSDKFSQFIKSLFNLRLVMKSLGLTAQESIKCIMNCAFGRNILKDNNYKSSYYRYLTPNDKVKVHTFLTKNFHLIKPEILCFGFYKKISKRNTSVPEGYPHIGSAILETSKYLMNKAFNMVNDQVYYTDTDSMHITANLLPVLKPIIGKQMCQFHSDFDPSTESEICLPVDYSTGIVAIESIFVMKKCYFDELLCIDKNSNKFCLKIHKRVKGVPSGFMDKQKYLQLINGEELKCDITKYVGMVTRKTKGGELYKNEQFVRTLRQTPS